MVLVSVAGVLTGCGANPVTGTSPLAGAKLTGRVQGGQQPIVGARVYLLAAGTGGYGGPGIAASASNASISLLTGTGNSDTIGGYVVTDANGNFSITSDYTCTSGQQVYLYALGGNPGGGTNSAAGLLAALGSCPGGGTFPSSTFIFMNEVSTIATAYSFAGFASDATHVSSSSTTLAKTGMTNAFATAAQLETLSTGVAATTIGTNGTAPQTEINTLANILAACINSTGPGSTACTTLLGDALSGGTTGTAPPDTATAAINIAHNPGANVSALYALASSSPPFAPGLSAAPTDFAIALKFTAGGIGSAVSIAVDATQNVWTVSTSTNTINEFSNAGAVLSGTSGFTGGGLNSPMGLAIDLTGNIWVANSVGSVSEFSSSGGAITTGLGILTGGLNGAGPWAVAVDGGGNVWVADDTSYMPHVSELSSSGAAVSPSGGYTGGGVNNAVSVAIDASGNAWFADDYTFAAVSKFSGSTGTGYNGGGLAYPGPSAIAIDASGNVWAACTNKLVEYSNGGTAISPSTGYTGGGIGLTSLGESTGIAIDSRGNVWIADGSRGGISEFSNAGAAITPSTGYTAAGVLGSSYGVALDSSGNLWVADDTGAVEKLVGMGAPVVTPLSAAVKNNQIATAP
ncbi:MAG TPA: NHL repeat-containing protein [Acidobacteriaceae bacterium]|nr:NHL repeat-containing protein [Acidobacteriaceae bacterium]